MPRGCAQHSAEDYRHSEMLTSWEEHVIEERSAQGFYTFLGLVM